MSQPNFDERAATWDDDPNKVRRAEDIARAIAERVPLDHGMRALEYGCGTGLLSFALADQLGDITLADTSIGMLTVLREKISRWEARAGQTFRPLQLDLSCEALPDERFDLVYSAMTLHHIPDTARVLTQFHNLLRSGGHLCIADLDREDGSFHGPDVDVHHGFDRTELAAQLQAAGFEKVRIDTAFQMHRGTRAFPVFLAVAQRVR